MVFVVVMIMGQGSDTCDVSGDVYGLGGDSDVVIFFIGDDGDGGGGIGGGC